MPSEHPADFLCQQTSPNSFAISPCTFAGLVWLHEHVFPREVTYDGKPITLDIPGILSLVEKLSLAGFEIVFLNTDLTRLKRELGTGNNG